MPELPEVELARRQLLKWIGGRTVVAVHALPTRILRGTSVGELAQALVGRKVVGVERRGKVLLVQLDNCRGVMVHLGMTGKFLYREAADDRPTPRFSKIALGLDCGGGTVHYVDQRLFGHFFPVTTNDIMGLPPVAKMGPDPLLDGLDGAVLGRRLGNTRRAIKVALMDSVVIAGVGNIQAGEALWRAGISPQVPARELTPEERDRLARAIVDSIMETLDQEEGDGEITYVDEAGGENPFTVYRKQGTPCPRCGGIIEREVLGGRGTFWCPRCQPPSPETMKK